MRCYPMNEPSLGLAQTANASVNFVVYMSEDEQVGYARVFTDGGNLRVIVRCVYRSAGPWWRARDWIVGGDRGCARAVRKGRIHPVPGPAKVDGAGDKGRILIYPKYECLRTQVQVVEVPGAHTSRHTRFNTPDLISVSSSPLEVDAFGRQCQQQ